MKMMSFSSKGRSYKVRAMQVGSDFWLHVNGETWVLDLKPKAKEHGVEAGGARGADKIRAPMPGKVLKVHVQAGKKVESQQVLVVMEAMKMEYSLTAAADGEVEEVLCQEGQQVDLNQVLVRLKLINSKIADERKK